MLSDRTPERPNNSQFPSRPQFLKKKASLQVFGAQKEAETSSLIQENRSNSHPPTLMIATSPQKAQKAQVRPARTLRKREKLEEESPAKKGSSIDGTSRDFSQHSSFGLPKLDTHASVTSNGTEKKRSLARASRLTNLASKSPSKITEDIEREIENEMRQYGRCTNSYKVFDGELPTEEDADRSEDAEGDGVPSTEGLKSTRTYQGSDLNSGYTFSSGARTMRMTSNPDFSSDREIARLLQRSNASNSTRLTNNRSLQRIGHNFAKLSARSDTLKTKYHNLPRSLSRLLDEPAPKHSSSPSTRQSTLMFRRKSPEGESAESTRGGIDSSTKKKKNERTGSLPKVPTGTSKSPQKETKFHYLSDSVKLNFKLTKRPKKGSKEVGSSGSHSRVGSISSEDQVGLGQSPTRQGGLSTVNEQNSLIGAYTNISRTMMKKPTKKGVAELAAAGSPVKEERIGRRDFSLSHQNTSGMFSKGKPKIFKSSSHADVKTTVSPIPLLRHQSQRETFDRGEDVGTFDLEKIQSSRSSNEQDQTEPRAFPRWLLEMNEFDRFQRVDGYHPQQLIQVLQKPPALRSDIENYHVFNWLKRSGIFRGKDPEMIKLVSEQMTSVAYRSGEKLVNRAQASEAMFYIFQGSVEVKNMDGSIKVLREAELVGRIDVSHNTREIAEAIALSRVIAFRINLGDLLHALSAVKNVYIKFLRSIGVFKEYSLPRLSEFFLSCEIATKQDGEVLYEIDDLSDAFYIILEGSVKFEVPYLETKTNRWPKADGTGYETLTKTHSVMLPYAQLREKNFFGHEGIIEEKPRQVRAFVLKTARLMKCGLTDFRQIFSARDQAALVEKGPGVECPIKENIEYFVKITKEAARNKVEAMLDATEMNMSKKVNKGRIAVETPKKLKRVKDWVEKIRARKSTENPKVALNILDLVKEERDRDDNYIKSLLEK